MNFRLPAKLAFVTLLAVIIATSIHPAASVKAQSGLSEEQLALLERAVNAVNRMDDYISYVSIERSFRSFGMSLTLSDINQQILRSQQLDKTTTYILGDNPNVLAFATYTSEESQQEGTIVSSYTVDAEARYVDGVLYTNITPTDGDVTDLLLPEGWVEVEDVTAYEIFDDLGLDHILGEIESGPIRDSLMKNLVLLEKIVQDVTVEETTLEDGTTVNVFTLTFNAVDLMREAPERFTEADFVMQAFGLKGLPYTLTIILDANDNPLAYSLSGEGTLIGLDASTFSSSLAGATLNLSLVFSDSVELSQVNEEIEPVAAPE